MGRQDREAEVSAYRLLQSSCLCVTACSVCLCLNDHWLSVRQPFACGLSEETHLVVLWRTPGVGDLPSSDLFIPVPSTARSSSPCCLLGSSSSRSISQTRFLQSGSSPAAFCGVHSTRGNFGSLCHAKWLSQWYASSQLHCLFPIYVPEVLSSIPTDIYCYLTTSEYFSQARSLLSSKYFLLPTLSYQCHFPEPGLAICHLSYLQLSPFT